MTRFGSYPSPIRLPIAVINEHGISKLTAARLIEYQDIRTSEWRDRLAQNAVERISDRPAPNRWRDA
jgi:hypothetical protein